MTFFNQKEEVIQIELTQYGKYLLSRGKLKPTYYAFFDDDIVYDGKYTNIQENYSTSVERIKTIPRTKAQYVFSGIEEQVKKNLELIKSNKEKLDSLHLLPQAEQNYVLSQRLGNSYLGDKNAPSLNITCLRGEILKTTFLQTGSMPNTKIPILELKDCDYRVSKNALSAEKDINNLSVAYTFKNGTSIHTSDDYLLLEFFEENTEDDSKNFDIELFVSQKDEKTNQETFVPLHFDQQFQMYKNDILLDSKDVDLNDKDLTSFKERDQFRAENYFNISIDKQIDKNIICKLINKMKQNISQYDPQFDCEEYEESLSSRTAEQRDIEGLYDASFAEKDIDKC
jgi:hypothetical protein